MTELSARFALPFILPGQAQKEVFHNEALAAVDGLLHPSIEGIEAAPPAGAQEGQCWAVGAGAAGEWAGREGQLALRTSGGWRFLVPVRGMNLWDRGAGHGRYWTGSAWSDGTLPVAAISVSGQQVVGRRQPHVPSPSGGTTIDLEARAALNAVIVALKSHGLID